MPHHVYCQAGESLADRMFAPLLVDYGFSSGQISTWSGVHGLLASIGGSLCGGKLASVTAISNAVFAALVVRLAGALIQLMFVVTPAWHTPALVVATLTVEGFCGGLLTTCVFAYMMSIVRGGDAVLRSHCPQVDARISATHFSLLAAIEVAGKSLPSLLSGFLLDALGVPVYYVLATVVSAVCGDAIDNIMASSRHPPLSLPSLGGSVPCE